MARKHAQEDTPEETESSARPEGPSAWSLAIPSGPAATFAERALAAETKFTAPSEGAKEQRDVAVEAVIKMVAAVQPNGEGNVGATLSGYANPGHTPSSTGTLDQIVIKLLQS